MFYSVSIILLFIIIKHHFFIPFSNAIPSVDDKMLITFMKGQQEIQFSEYSMQKYLAYLGIVYYMRKKWHCDKIWDGFEEFERTECQKYRKYLDLLYEYLYREYVGIPTVKPKFVFKRKRYGIEIDGPIIYAINCLARISLFYLNPSQFHHDLNFLFITIDWVYQPTKLLNEKGLKQVFKFENELKMPINEMILQLAIDAANEWQTNGNLDGIIQQNFDKNLEEMFKKAKERAKNGISKREAEKINKEKQWILLNSKYDDTIIWTDDALFSEFVKGLTTNFDNFLRMAKKFPVNLFQKYEISFGVMYLMRKNWHCDKIRKELEKNCQRYQKYLDILYEYLFRLYANAKSPEVSKEMPQLVKPIFFGRHLTYSLIKVVAELKENFKCFWKEMKTDLEDFDCNWAINLVNEEEFDNEMKEGKGAKNSSIKIEIQIQIAKLRKEFELKMEKLCENAEENIREE